MTLYLLYFPQTLQAYILNTQNTQLPDHAYRHYILMHEFLQNIQIHTKHISDCSFTSFTHACVLISHWSSGHSGPGSPYCRVHSLERGIGSEPNPMMLNW